MMTDILRYKLTYLLVFINILVYAFSALSSADMMDMDLQILVDMGALYSPLVLQADQWWRLFTAMFLHGSITHLLMNMFSLYLIGRSVELYLSNKSYLSIYLFSGLLGGLFSLMMHPNTVGVGASGAIFGLFGALAGFFLAHREQIQAETKAFMKSFALIIGINLAIGLSIESIDLVAHIAGLSIGFIGGFLLSKSASFVMLYNSVMLLLSLFLAYYLSSSHVPILF
jgi:rhomboid protease GluP